MSSLNTLGGLQVSIMSWLGRTDIVAELASFIAAAEEGFNNDGRIRRLVTDEAFDLSADGMTLPAELISIESWSHSGPSRFGEIEPVSAGALDSKRAQHGLVGAPRYFAQVNDSALFAPAPDATYPTRMTYWQGVPPLPVVSDLFTSSSATNWFLGSNFAIYLYGALVQTAPYLADDDRVPVWRDMLEERIEAFYKRTMKQQWGPTAVRRPPSIGG